MLVDLRTQEILQEQVPPREDVVRGLLEVTATLAQSLSTDPNPVAAEMLVSAALSVGDVTSWGLVEDEPRTVEVSGGTSLTVVEPSSSGLSRGFSLESFSVPPLAPHTSEHAHIVILKWPSNPFGQLGEEGSGAMLTFSVRVNGSNVPLANLDPPLSIAVREAEITKELANGTVVQRSCVFWNSSRGKLEQ